MIPLTPLVIQNVIRNSDTILDLLSSRQRGEFLNSLDVDERDLIKKVLNDRRRENLGSQLLKASPQEVPKIQMRKIEDTALKLLQILDKKVEQTVSSFYKVDKTSKLRFYRDHHLEQLMAENAAPRTIKSFMVKIIEEEGQGFELLKEMEDVAQNYFANQNLSYTFFPDVLSFFEGLLNMFKNFFSLGGIQLDRVLNTLQARIEEANLPIDERLPPLPSLSFEERKALLGALAEQTRVRVEQEMRDANTYYALTIGETVVKYTHQETEAIGSGSEACFADEAEWRALSQMKNAIELGEEPLSDTDRRNFNCYYDSVKRSRPLNQALEAFYLKLESSETPQEVDQQAYITAFREEILEMAQGLRAEESLFLNMGHHNHAFRIAIQRTSEGNFTITLYESGVGLEASLLTHSGILSSIATLRLNDPGHPVYTALRLEVTAREFEEKGDLFLYNMLHRASLGMKEDREIQQPFSDEIAKLEKELEDYDGWNFLKIILTHLRLKYLRIQELIPYHAKWGKTLAAFASIAPEKVTLVPVLHRSQRMGICATKRLRINQLHELGFALYTKIHKHIQREIKRAILDDFWKRKCIPPELSEQLSHLPAAFLDKSNLQKAAKALAQCERIPPYPDVTANLDPNLSDEERSDIIRHRQGENYTAALNVIMVINHQLARLDRAYIVEEAESSEKVDDEIVMNAGLTDRDLKEAIRIKAYSEGKREKVHGIAVMINGQNHKISKKAYLKLVLNKKNRRLLDPSICAHVLFLLSGQLTPKERQLALRIVDYIRVQMAEKRNQIMEKALASLHDVDDAIEQEREKIEEMRRLGIPSTVVEAYTAALFLERLQLQSLIVDYQNYFVYIRTKGVNETAEQAQKRLNDPSFIATSYFEAVEKSQRLKPLVQEIEWLIREKRQELEKVPSPLQSSVTILG